VSFHTSDSFQEISERHSRLVEEIRQKPDLPLAMHEAGRAFAYERHDIRVSRCVLEASSPRINGEPALCCSVTELTNRHEITKDNLWQEVVCVMAGAAAQHAVDEHGAMLGASGDLARTEEWIKRVELNQQQADELILAASKAAAKMMTENIATVRKIANVLEQKKRIAGNEIREIMRQDRPRNILAL
jgi:ATP-dependent Zn protease